MKPDRRRNGRSRSFGATALVSVAAIVAAIIAGRVILLKFLPGSLPLLAWIADLGN